MSDTMFQTDLLATPAATGSLRFAIATRAILARVRAIPAHFGAVDAHDAIEQVTVWASLGGCGFFVAAMIAAAMN